MLEVDCVLVVVCVVVVAGAVDCATGDVAVTAVVV